MSEVKAKMPKNKPDLSPSEEFIQQSKPDNLLEQTLQLANIQLSVYKKKLATEGELTDKENTVLCTFMRTFAQISKMQKDLEKEKKKEVAELSDEELRAEIARLTAGTPEEDL